MGYANKWGFEPRADSHVLSVKDMAPISQAISLKRIADALERQNDLTAQLWLHQGKQQDAVTAMPADASKIIPGGLSHTKG